VNSLSYTRISVIRKPFESQKHATMWLTMSHKHNTNAKKRTMAYSISPQRKNFLSNSTQKAKELTKYTCRNTYWNEHWKERNQCFGGNYGVSFNLKLTQLSSWSFQSIYCFGDIGVLKGDEESSLYSQDLSSWNCSVIASNCKGLRGLWALNRNQYFI